MGFWKTFEPAHQIDLLRSTLQRDYVLIMSWQQR